MILGVGVDVLHLPRLSRLVHKYGSNKLAQRILSPLECRSLPSEDTQAIAYLALRWTAKEAAFKALYPGYQARWKDFSVIKHGPKPALTSDLPVHLHLSISHDADLVVALVVAESM